MRILRKIFCWVPSSLESLYLTSINYSYEATELGMHSAKNKPMTKKEREEKRKKKKEKEQAK
jgi:hypothetical protein